MDEKTSKPQSRKHAIRFVPLALSLILPFVLQKWNLDTTRGGWRPEEANFTSHWVVPSLLLPLIAISLLPLRWQKRVALTVVLTPIFLFAFGYFTVDYACNNYNGYCF